MKASILFKTLTIISQLNFFNDIDLKNIYQAYENTYIKYADLLLININKMYGNNDICNIFLSFANKRCLEFIKRNREYITNFKTIEYDKCDYFNSDLVISLFKYNKINKFILYPGSPGYRYELYNLDLFVKNIGYYEYLTEFTFSDFDSLDIYQILDSFPNLCKLHLYSLFEYESNGKHMGATMLNRQFNLSVKCDNVKYTKITYLTLAHFMNKLLDEDIKNILINMPNLVYLNLSHAHNLTDSTLSIVKNLKSLNISSCNKLSSNILYEILDIHPNLEMFNLSCNKHINNDLILNIARKLTKLKEITLDQILDDDYEIYRACLIKYFDIKSMSYSIHQLINSENFDKNYSEFLEKL